VSKKRKEADVISMKKCEVFPA